jgi:hypothetical protein
MTKHVAQQH